MRVGETVRRTVSSECSAVPGLLRYLEAQELAGVPRFLGMDEQGREILTYLSGEVGFMPYLWDGDGPLLADARLLRAYHDATIGYTPPDGVRWQYIYPDSNRHEVICHNDFAPYNLVCANGLPYAVIDFDMAGPGPRLRDIAYAAYWLAPLAFGNPDMDMRARADVAVGSPRLHRFCETYGITAASSLLDMVEEVLQFFCDWLTTRAEAGNEISRRLIAEGHLAAWQNALEGFRLHRGELESNL